MPNFSGESHLVTSDPSRAHLQFEPQAQLQSTAMDLLMHTALTPFLSFVWIYAISRKTESDS